MDITVLELHLPEAEFNAPFTGSGPRDRESGVRADVEDESEGGRGSGLVVIAVLVGLVALAWYLRSGRDDGGMGVEHDTMVEGPA